ncbi:MAG: DUF2752 domain-containing protein [Propionicimonas sp.]|uniref:DUF2752 domain-containing protein n=1 Tax=Propionicimonas sp. TaxID=1955623 RepID=UPI002B1F311F|nr:DUF2752 domain-containing protein [Propionicimonas sp.]MEA4943354.1 DUF2752 domain-containing protein [Propionicimonas sp.]
MAQSVQPARFSPTRALRSAGWLGAVGLALSGAKLFAGVGIPCPWRTLTGTLCPFCGSTRLGVSLLQGDLAAAWVANPFVLVLLGGLGLAVVAWSVEALGGPALRPPAGLRSAALWSTVFVVTALGFALVRNLWQ